MGLDSWLKKLRNWVSKKPVEGEPIPENWVPDLIKKHGAELDEDGTLRVIYEEKKTKRYIARRVKRIICFLLIIINFVMLVTCFFVEGGIMSPFFLFNTVFLADYFYMSRPQPLEKYR